jgi:uncharacterized protein YjgD (DUF1641 family)
MTTAVQELPVEHVMAESLPAERDPLLRLEERLDRLATQVARLGEQMEFLAEEAYAARRRRTEMEELQSDLLPIARDLYAVTVAQLEEIQAYVQLEDVLHLVKRLARNTRNLHGLLDQMESLLDLGHDLAPISKELFDQAVTLLDQLEQKGYFGFARQSLYVADRIVTAFGEEDVRLLGDNIVTILTTVKALTQPEIMRLVHNLTVAYQGADAQELPTGLWGLLQQMRDPQVRRGLALTMAMLKRIAAQTPGPA